MSDVSTRRAFNGKLAVLPPETRSMHLSDGTRLDADIYRPADPGPYPVLLQRQAYGRRIACSICYAHPAWYAAHGYIVVVQDVRGRGTSEGTFRPGENDLEDGAEAVEWAAKLEGSTGDVGMYGFSYQAYNQLLAAAGDSPSLKAIAPAMGPWDAGSTWTFENGALRMKQMIGWGIQITAEAARRAGDDKAYAALMAASANLPLHGPIAARPALLEEYRIHSHVMDWLETPADSPFWASISPATHAERIKARKLPMLFVGGWFDTHLSSTVQAWRALSRSDDTLSRLIVGPWVHFPWVSNVGAVDFGSEADRDIDTEHIHFFDQALKGKPDTRTEPNPVSFFDMGTRSWRSFPNWPKGETILHLSGTGRASIRIDDGVLTEQAGASDINEYLVHDPWRPAPVTGGCYGVPAGPVDRRTTDERGDVLTFTTAPLKESLALAGESLVELSAMSDCPSFDLSCVLSRVTVDGKVLQIASGYAHYPDAGRKKFLLKLTATCCTINPGERLRLSVAASDYPAHPVNPGTGEDPASAPKTRAVVTTIAVSHGPSSGSILVLPVVAKPSGVAS
jgi:putative CocE/NonD family hydrolase